MHNHSNNDIQIDVEPLPFQQIPNWVFESKISPTAIKLYLVLKRNGDNKRGTSFYSRKKLGEHMACSSSTIDRAKAELLELGAICMIKRRSSSNDFTSNLYHIHTTPRLNCKYLHAKSGVGANLRNESDLNIGSPKNEATSSPIDGELTNNHIELRTNELITRTYSGEAKTACNLLADLIEANGSVRPIVTNKWLVDMERLNRIDGRTWEQITAAITWCQNDEFWRANIMSPGKLRKQYDQLRLKAQSQQKSSNLSGWARVIAKLENQQKELES